MLSNFKIRWQILLSFTAVIAVLISIVFVGVMQIDAIKQKSSEVYKKNVRPLETLESFKSNYAELRRLVTTTVVNGAIAPMETTVAGIKALELQYVKVQESMQDCINRLTENGTDKERLDAANAVFNNVNNKYWPVVEEIKEAALTGDILTMTTEVAEAGTIATEINETVNAIFADRMTEAAVKSEQIEKTAQRAMIILAVSGLTGIIASFAAALFMGGLLSKRINALRSFSKEIAAGNLTGETPKQTKDEIGELSNDLTLVAGSVDRLTSELGRMASEYKKGNIFVKIDSSGLEGVYKTIADEMNTIFAVTIDETLTFLKCVAEFADGNFDVYMPKMPGEKIVMNDTLDSVRGKLKDVVSDISVLVNAAAQGKLSDRVDAERYKGDWGKLMDALNRLMEAVATPISEAESVLAQVAAGNFSQKITGNYYGQFLQIKNSVNNMVTNVDSYIGEISSVLSELANNNLDQNINREYVGKFSEIRDALNNITNKFNHVILEISSVADQVTDGARQISGSSITLAQGASEQAASVEELSATVDSINQNTSHNAVNAAQARDLSEHAKESAARGDMDMDNMLASMQSIKTSSNSISKIIKVIEDIAFQTNLLSLNAAVEAARAGVHGKGFAVVAEQVRDLAKRSRDAANETSEMIEESIIRVNEGTKMAGVTAQALQAIVEDASKVAAIIGSIADASQEQAVAIGQVMDGLSQITVVTQDNSALSEEAAAASQELSSQSEALRGLVNVFRLKRY